MATLQVNRSPVKPSPNTFGYRHGRGAFLSAWLCAAVCATVTAVIAIGVMLQM